MAKVAIAYEDAMGLLHGTPEGAALSELTKVLGRVGAESSLLLGFAKTILEKRPEIERVFADFDAMRAHQEQVA